MNLTIEIVENQNYQQASPRDKPGSFWLPSLPLTKFINIFVLKSVGLDSLCKFRIKALSKLFLTSFQLKLQSERGNLTEGFLPQMNKQKAFLLCGFLHVT